MSITSNEEEMLRVGVVVGDGAVPRWIAEIVGEIAERSMLIGLLVDRSVGPTASRVWRAYAALDRRFAKTSNDALAPVAAEDLPACGRMALADSPDLSAWRLDVVLVLAESPAASRLLAFARLGIVDVLVDDAPFAIGIDRALLRRSSTAQVAARLTEGGGGTRLLASALTSTDLGSLGRTRNELLWKSAALVTRGLRGLALEPDPDTPPASTPFADPWRPAGPAGSRVPSASARLAPPQAAEGLAFAGRLVARAARRRLRALLERDPWFLALRRHQPGPPGRDASGFRAFFAPRDRYWADPFLFRKDGASHLFVEEFQWRRGKGEIAWVELPGDRVPDGPLRAEVVLSGPRHLAYPLVFERDGAIYMLPDDEDASGLQLWRAEEFPRRWRLERVLLEGLALGDATLVEHGGLLFLLATMAAPHGRAFDELHVFWAERLEGPWSAHARNPVVVDIGSARCAGRALAWDGGLLRPAQDSRLAYGHAMTFQAVRRLTPDEYVEEPAWRVEPTWREGLIATHTWNSDGFFDAVDGRIRRWVWQDPRNAGRTDGG